MSGKETLVRAAESLTEEELWKRATWEGNERDHQDRFLAATPAERFQWLSSTFELLKDVLPKRG